MATPQFTTPTTWTPGDFPAAADLNTELRDNVEHVATPVSCQAVRSSNLSISNATWVALTFTASDNWDTDSIHSTSSNPSRFTVPTGQDGKYEVKCFAAFANNTTGTARLMRLTKNGSVIAANPAGYLDGQTPGTGSQGTFLNGSRDISLAAGDYIEVEVFQDAAASASLNISDATLSFRKWSE